ncbi:MAG: tRNA glutamyl-Q(34) synthetase GluQRS [Veillonellaceae bacterium]|nr:tRNA glutamyl-Q(34) synthetase GluQRS [Veillonellaceae bacterium]
MNSRNFSATSSPSASEYRGRFAPSPTGYLHLGHAWVALISRCAARRAGGKWVLRVEDIDRERCRAEYEEALYEDLTWLGLTWDEGPDCGGPYGPYRQSERAEQYEAVLAGWRREGLLYPCTCRRARLQAVAAAPHRGERRTVYDGHCRRIPAAAAEAALRWRGEDETIRFWEHDGKTAVVRLYAATDDIILQRADGAYSYQFAVAYDDATMRLTEVVRSNDLWDSTAWQVRLIERLGYTAPVYWHVPVLTDHNGVRLSKRQQGTTLRELRAAGKTPAEIFGLLLQLAGANPSGRPLSLAEVEASDLRTWDLGADQINAEEEMR